jgi:hypothetical protein
LPLAGLREPLVYDARVRSAREELGFEAAIGLQDGLRRTVEWAQVNTDRIDACIDCHADRLATA